MVYLDDSDYPQRLKPEVFQCRWCGSIHKSINDVVLDHWLENGCPDCQKRFRTNFERLMNKAGLTEEVIQKILENGLDG